MGPFLSGGGKQTIKRRDEKGWHNFQRDLYKELVDAWVLFDNAGKKPKLLDEGVKE